MLNLKYKIPAKLILLILAQITFFISAVYPEYSTNKSISSLYIQAKGLRVPLDSANDYSRMREEFNRRKSTGPEASQRGKTFYAEFANRVRADLGNADGGLCKTHSVFIVKRLLEQYKITAIIMEEIIGDGVHYWVETKDFIIDAFPEGRAFDLAARTVGMGTGSVIVIEKNNMSTAEKDIAKKFYSKGKYRFDLTGALSEWVATMEAFSKQSSPTRTSL